MPVTHSGRNMRLNVLNEKKALHKAKELLAGKKPVETYKLGKWRDMTEDEVKIVEESIS